MNPIDEIKKRLDLVDLIAEFVKLNQAGSNFKALCPFHNEKTPSFMVSPEKQIWHCFGCSKGGDHFAFIRELEGVEFPEALRILARRAGVKLEYRNPEFHNQKSKLLDLCRTIADRWHQVLLADQTAGPVRQYLAERKVNPETIEAFNLCYAKDSWDDDIKYLQEKNFSLKEIADAGISAMSQQGKVFDRFKARLIFPIRDVHGNVVGFTARKMTEEDQGGKYINSPQTAIYNKSSILYNLDLAKTEIKRLNYAILVEGNMDAIASWQSGAKNVIAVSGTALTADQIVLLKRYTINVMIAFDADVAGTKANLRGIDLAWQAGLNVKVIHLPEGSDPDDLIRQDPAKWKELIRSSTNFMDYIFEVTFRDLDLSRVDHKKLAAKKILPLLSKMGDEVEKFHYVKKLSTILGVAEEVLLTALKGLKVKTEKPTEAIKEAGKPVDHEKAMAEQLVALLLVFPEQLKLVIQHLRPEEISFKPASDLYKDLVIEYNKGEQLTENNLLESLNPEQSGYLSQLSLYVDKDFFADRPDLINHEIGQLVNRLKTLYIKKRLQALSAELQAAEQESNQQSVEELSRE